MEELAEAIVESGSLMRDLFLDWMAGQAGNLPAVDQAAIWDSINSIFSNFASFLVEFLKEMGAVA